MSTNMHLAMGNGGIVKCELFPGQMQDFKIIKYLWKDWNWKTIKVFVADKGYASSDIREHIKSHGALPIIPTKGVWQKSDEPIKEPSILFTKLYKMSSFIERFFGRIKHNKRIATRFDKLDVSFLAFIPLASLKAYKLLC